MRAAAVGHVDPSGLREGLQGGAKADAVCGADKPLDGKCGHDALHGGAGQSKRSRDLAKTLPLGMFGQIAQNGSGAGDDLDVGLWE